MAEALICSQNSLMPSNENDSRVVDLLEEYDITDSLVSCRCYRWSNCSWAGCACLNHL
ncbi:unnamed protein product [Lathyrus sativus]|nr:unnamed protein product [Lathyrus sativus]